MCSTIHKQINSRTRRARCWAVQFSFCALVLCLLVRQGLSFAGVQVVRRIVGGATDTSSSSSNSRIASRLAVEPAFIDESLKSEVIQPVTPTPTPAEAVKDDKGNEFVVGGVVRVVGENLKAYQVPPKGYGSYDSETKEFVPLPEGGTARYLVLPVGLRAKVTKVYDVEDVSANFPIQVKFVPGEDTDEGYDPPLPFIMHFDTHEIECCV